MDTTTHDTEQKTTLLRTIIARLNEPSADRYSAVIRQRTFGRARIAESKAPAGPHTQSKPSYPSEAKHWTKLAS